MKRGRPTGTVGAPKRAKRVADTGLKEKGQVALLRAHKWDARGKTYLWECRVFRSGLMVRRWGQDGGKMQERRDVVTEGRAKRTIIEQAMLEAKQYLNVKLSTGYTEGPPKSKPRKRSVTAGKPFKPMTLKILGDYHARVHSRHKKVFVQPKLDGVRAILHPSHALLHSRPMKPFGNPLTFVKEQCGELMKRIVKQGLDPKSIALDGELFAPPPTNFNAISGHVRRKTGDPFKEGVRYFVYDLVDRSRPTLPFSERWSILKSILKPPLRGFVLVDTRSIDSDMRSLEKEHGAVTKRGFEGLVVRTPNGVYKVGGRSDEVLKFKTFQQEEYRVVGVIPKAGAEDVVGAVELEITKGKAKGTRFTAAPAMTEPQKRAMMATFLKTPRKLINEWATVKFQELSHKGVPRFGQLLGFRGKVKF